tara:strand:- start:68 stop:589 length:522 start_codon:yes stop_codon:yes gene_type:complete
MNMLDTPLEQIGASAHGHYTVAAKAAGKAEEHYKSAGIYLKHAKLRVLKTRGLTWERWLMGHCPIGKSRADEVIAISDGTKTQEELREQANARDRAYREKQREERDNSRRTTADRPEKPNENNERRPYVKPEVAPMTPQQEANEARTLMLNAVILKVQRLTYRELLQLKVHLA